MKQFVPFLWRRLLLMVISLAVLISVTFFLVNLAPADPARAVGGPYATADQIEQIRHQLGLDQPLFARFFSYWGQLFQGNLGTSLYSPDRISDNIGKFLPSTLELIILSLVVALVIGLALGIVSSYFHRRWQDRVSSGVVGVLQSVPDFVMAVIVIYLLSYVLNAAPGPEGQLSIATTPPPTVTGMILVDALIEGDPATITDAIQHMVLPVLTLGLVLAAVFARISRAALREAFESEQTKFARACGLSEWRIVRNAMLTSRTPILTYGAIIFAAGFGGTAIVEKVFNWNGVSQWAVQSMERNDYPAVEGFVLIAGAITLVVYMLLDVLVNLLDPRMDALAPAKAKKA
ncbi:ABC transporter permease [Sinomonas sp. ASV486]|uniref:ABC transporter permease n=1 Tax=Sinomonas sp. ASV486 TaxID=3051170 RepID=UPI0027DACABF|nr:ABC transporter permease [Sinomonas sp. ASV486]MDQ4489804.1 ABC transporter permease [Sinomonas sp. ASV486]